MVVKFKLQQILRIGLLMMGPFFAWSNSAVAANIIYQNSFDNLLGDATASNGACYPYSVQFADPLGGSNNTLRLEQRGDAPCLQYGGTYKHRTQITPGGDLTPDKVRFAIGVEYWVGFKIFVPSNYPSASAGTMISELIEAGKSGETAIFTRGHEVRFVRRYVDDAGKLQEFNKWAPLPLGQWSTIVYRLKRSLTNTGYVEFWLNGEKVSDSSFVNVRTATNYAALGEGYDPFMHIGIYWAEETRGNDDYILYFDNLTIATGANGYDLVMGDTITPPTPVGLQLIVD